MKTIHAHPLPSKQHRRGVTLTEVLMSLMIMGIGVTAVATLFPIAALRSAQATKLTNAAILKRNVEAQLRAQPWIVFDPDGDSNYTEHFRDPANRRYVIDPVGFYTQKSGWFGNNGGTAVQVLPRFDAGLASSTGLDATVAAELLALQQQASSAATLGDGWDTVVDTFAEELVLNGASQVVGVKLPTDVDLTDLQDVDSESYTARLGYDPGLTRVTVFSADSQFSEVDTVFRFSDPQTLLWSSGVLPPHFDFDGDGTLEDGEVGRVVIQTKRTSDFSWILTIRRGGDGRTSGVDVVVMFNNGRIPEDEQVYESTFIKGTNQIGIRIPTTAEPVIRRGGFVLDLENARWYRISQVTEPGLTNYSHILEVEGTITEANGEDQYVLDTNGNNIAFNGVIDTKPGTTEDINGNGGPNPDYGHIMLIPDVVEVFPLGSFPVPNAIIPRNF